MIKFISYLVFVSLLRFIFAPSVFAHCPLCVAGAGAGLSLSRLLGIDDSITGVWMGGVLGATGFWIDNLTKSKNFVLKKELLYVLIIALTVLSFYRFGLINEHNGLILNLPKLVFGIIVGGFVFYLVDVLNKFLRRKNGKRLFPYQGVLFSLSSLLVTSIGVFILINYYI